MSINSVSFINSYSYCAGSPLSEATKRKLIALGIDPSTVHSEAEAKALIDNIVQMRQQANIPVPKGISPKADKKEELKEAEKTENMLSMMNYESEVKKIILGL